MAYDAACSYFFQPLANQSILVGVKCHQTAANFFCRYGSTGFRIPNTLIYGSESFLVFIIDDRREILQIELLWLCQATRLARHAPTFYLSFQLTLSK